MKYISAILCEKSTIDSETNNISLYNCLEKFTIGVPNNIQTNGIINVPVNYEIISFWIDDSNNKTWKGEILIEFYDPQVNKLKEFKMDLSNLGKPGNRLRARQRISGIGVKESGYYLFKLKYRENKNNTYETMAEIPLEIVINKQKLLK